MGEQVKAHAKRSKGNNNTSNSKEFKSNAHHAINSGVDHILFLQKTIGNKALHRLFKSGAVQTKLKISHPNDIYEQEADRIAKQIMRGSKASIQYKKKSSGSTIKQQPVEQQTYNSLNQLPARTVQNTEPDPEKSIQRMRSKGKPLTDKIRTPMELAFGTDFSKVRIHTNSESDKLNQSLNADAFTTKQDIFFRKGTYNPDSSGGQELIAHELTHVLQQEGLHRPKTNILTSGKGTDVWEAKVQKQIFTKGQLPPKISTGLSSSVIARSWSNAIGYEHGRVDFLSRRLRERGYQIEVTGRDESDSLPSNWRITAHGGSVVERTRQSIIQYLQELDAREFPEERAREEQDRLPPDYIAGNSEANAFWTMAINGRITAGSPVVRLFGPSIVIDRMVAPLEGRELGPPTRVRIDARQYGIYARRSEDRLVVQPFRFAPTDRSDPFYRGRESTYDSWQDFNYQLFTLVVTQRRSPSDARSVIRARDRDLLWQMILYCIVSSA